MKTKNKNFVQIQHEIVKSGKGLSHRAFRLYSYLKCFDPCFPSREQIRLETGLTDYAISASLEELTKYNLLHYDRGNSRGKANRYYLHPQEDWKLPQNQRYSKKRGTRHSEANHFKNKAATTLNSGQVPNQNDEPNKSNDNYSNSNQSNELNQHKISKELDSLQFMSEDFFKKLTEHLRKFYGQFSMEVLKIPYSIEDEEPLSKDDLDRIVRRVQRITRAGGTLHGLVKNEFIRLKKQKNSRPAEPRFLLNKASRTSYEGQIAKEVFNEEFASCFGPIPYQMSTPRRNDKGYVYARRAFRHLLKIKSIDQYVIDSFDPKNGLPLLGPHLFKYAVVKEFFFDEETNLTKRAVNFYFSEVGSPEYRPFWNQTTPNTFDPTMEGWSQKGITRGGGRKYELFAGFASDQPHDTLIQ